MTALDNALKKIGQLYEEQDPIERWYRRQMRTYPGRKAVAYERQLDRYLRRKEQRALRRQRNEGRQEARRRADQERRQRVRQGLAKSRERSRVRRSDPVYAAQVARNYEAAGMPQSQWPAWIRQQAQSPEFQQASQSIASYRRGGGGVYGQSAVSPSRQRFQRSLGQLAQTPQYAARAAQTRQAHQAAQQRRQGAPAASVPSGGGGIFSSVGEGIGKGVDYLKGIGSDIGGTIGGFFNNKTAQSADLMSPMFGRYRMNFNRPFRFNSRRPLMTFGNGGRFVPGSGEQRFGGPFVPGAGEQRFGGKFKPGSKSKQVYGGPFQSGKFKPGSGVMFGKGKYRPRGL